MRYVARWANIRNGDSIEIPEGALILHSYPSGGGGMISVLIGLPEPVRTLTKLANHSTEIPT